MSRNLKLSQINLHHCKEATSVLRCKLDSGQTGISLIQEPYFFQRKVRGLGNAGPIHYVASGPKPARACVFVKKDLNSLLLKQFSNSDFVAVQIRYKDNGEDKILICCSAYLPYDEPAPTKELINIVRYCKNAGLDLLIGCDANSLHCVWGSSDTNQRGIKLLEFICAEELQILNKGNRPTFINRVREEVIDITLCSQEIVTAISNWHVSQEASMSDHQTIELQLNADATPLIPFRNPRKTNWNLYEEKLVHRMGNWEKSINDSRDVEEAVNDLTNSVISSYNESCTLKVPRSHKKPAWYSNEIEGLKRAFTRAWNARRNSWEGFVECRKAYKKAYRQAKRRSWRDFCESVEGVSATAKIHRILAKDRSELACTLKLPSGEYTSDENQLLNHLLGCQNLEPGAVDMISDLKMSEISANVLNKAKLITDPDNIRWAINCFSPYKSPGPDKIFPALLQKAIEPLLIPLSDIFTSCLALGYIPKSWREVRVTFSLGQNITVFQTEVFAINKCAEHCLQMNFRLSGISICSDSQAALKSLMSCKIDSALVLECKRKLEKLASANSVTLIWVPGHSDIFGNEMADELAREGSAMEPIGPTPAIPLSKNRFKAAIREWADKAHKIYWQSLESCKQTKILIKEPLSKSNATRVLSLRKDTLRKLVGVVTGHFYFNKHLYNMGLKNTSLCERCQSDEYTAYHLICLCPRLAQRRHRILGHFVLSEEQCNRLKIWKINEFISAISLDKQP